jgi:hypothetical protein
MNTVLTGVNELVQSVQSNPQFADMYCSLFSMAMETFDQTKSQRDDIDKFIEEIKAVAKGLQDNPPQPPPPTPQDQVAMAQAAELQAKAQLLQAQIQEIQAKIQKMQTPEAPEPVDNSGAYEEQIKAQAQQSAIASKHQNDMELQQMKIAADQNRAREKMQSDENLMRLKIEADKERYEEKMKGDYVEDVLPTEEDNA